MNAARSLILCTVLLLCGMPSSRAAIADGDSAVGTLDLRGESNVTFAQRTDGSKLVDIHYTLNGGTSSVALGVSLDGGTTFTSVKTLSGDVGSAVSSGTAKHIVWNAGADYPAAGFPNVKMRVTALLDGAGGTFAPIPGGTYQVGNLIGDADITDANPVPVTLSPYYMGVNDVTKEQWDLVRTWATANGYLDLVVGGGKASNHPVHTVSWFEAVKWANAASEKEGLAPCYKLSGAVYRSGTNSAVSCDWSANGYRLPTDAEWEVAARGGLSGKRFPWGDTISFNQSNYRASAGFTYDLSGSFEDFNPTYKAGGTPYTSPVGSFAANGYGLYDMCGNVWQWCWDWYGALRASGVDPRGAVSGSNRLFRGGNWINKSDYARLGYRGNFDPTVANSNTGFRLARARPSAGTIGAPASEGLVDTTPPVVTVPGPLSVSATSANGASVTLSGASATDNLGTPTVTYSPASGSTFPVGTTTVTVTATDSVGNVATGTFNVTVRDATPPVLTLPANITASATSATGAAVSFQATATDDSGAVPTIAFSIDPTSAVWVKRTETVSLAHFLRVSEGRAVTGSHYSDDGINWTPLKLPSHNHWLNGICYGGGKFVLTGAVGQIFVSSNGTSWTNVSPGGEDITGVTYGKGIFVARQFWSGGAMWRSSDMGATWSSVDSGPAPDRWACGLIFGNGVFVNPGRSVVKTSANASNWTTNPVANLPQGLDLLNITHFDGGLFVGAGESGRGGNGVNITTAQSENGRDWRFNTATISSASSKPFSSTGAGDGIVYVTSASPSAGGGPEAWFTSDAGLSWTKTKGPWENDGSQNVNFVSIGGVLVAATDKFIYSTGRPNSGSTFPVGTTTVRATAVDGAGNVASGTFRVTVSDTTAPVLSLPSDVSQVAASGGGAIVDYPAATAVDDVTPVPQIAYSKATGSLFAVGKTPVIVTATDGAGNVATGTFNVTVTGPLSVTAQPVSRTVVEGSSATFTVAVSGRAPYAYQWRKDGIDLPGGNSASFSIVAVTPSRAGRYSVEVTDSAQNKVTSEDAHLNVAGVNPALSVGLVAHYPLLSNCLDASGFERHGIPSGNLRFDPVDASAVFNGADAFISVKDLGAVGAAEMTCSCWVRLASRPSGRWSPNNIVSNDIPSNHGQGFGFSLMENSASLTVEYHNGFRDKVFTNFSDGQWVHVTVVYSSGSFKSFLNGELVETFNYSVGQRHGNPVMLIGKHNDDHISYSPSERFFKGSLRHLRIFNRALSDAEVTLVHDQEKPAIPPAILFQPSAALVSLGAPANFAVTVTGTAPTFQWRRNGVPIVGGTAASYTIASVQVAHSGDYDVVVSNAAGSVTSNVAKLTVPSGVSILTQPLSQNANPGAAVTLSVAASGPGPITYQWRRNGVAIKGATAASYRIAALQAAGEGLYDVVVTNRSGSLTSAQAAVAMNKPVVITRAPVALAVNPGAAASFSVVASGTEPLTYQWRKGTTVIPGATAATYEIPAAQSGDAASYSVVVKNVVGSVTSASAALTLNTPVRITTQPVGGGVNTGSSRTVSVVATGTAPLTYQWRRNGTAVAGGTRSSYTIAPAQESNVGIYDVLVGNVVGTVTSGTASVTLNAAPSIGTQPASLVVNPGKAAVFSVVAGGTAPLSYQWRRNGVNLSGATGATYTIGAAQTASAGTYDVVVRNVAGSATSAGATLSVNTPVSISQQPVSLAVNPGAEAVIRVTATGTAPLTYQWRKNGAAITGGTGASYAVRAVQASDSGSYDVVVGNPVGSVISSVARLTVNVAPAITIQPVGGVLNLGGSRTLSVAATGTAPLGYQWRKNGVPIAGATGTSYALGAVQAASAGTYDVVVSNPAGSATSAGALISVNAPPVITVQPGSLTVAAGGTLRLAVTAIGTGTLTYQWRKGGVNVAAATGPEYTVFPAQTVDAGSYDVVVRNAYGSVGSAGASVTVNAPAEVPRYQFIAGNFTWSQAKADAEARGGHLVTVTSAAEWQEVLRQVGVAMKNDVWLGVFQPPGSQEPAGGWKWLTGEPLTFQNWGPGEPNNLGGNEDYVHTYSDGKWNDLRPTERLISYILEIEAPEITSQPASLTVIAGSSATLSVSAFGGIPLSYQWRKNSVPITGGTQAAFTLPATALADAGSYDVVITNSKGSVTSNSATLMVNPPPLTILTHPLGTGINAGGTVTFSVAASGTAPLRYQWRKDGAPIANGTFASYRLSDIQSTDAAAYDVVVSDVTGSITSASALLALNVAPTLSAQPSPVAVNAGAPATLSVAVTGTGPITYQWRRDGVPVAGGTGATLTVPSAQLGDAGLYDVVLTNVAGTTTSAGARLSINTPVSIVSQPSPLALNPGASGALSVAVTGTGPFAYQWRKDGGPVAGANSATFALSNLQPSDAGSYDVVVSNVAGSVTSTGALVTLNVPVSITAQPQGGAFNPGAPLNLGVTAAGTGPFGYQWFKNGVPIQGAAGAVFAVSALTPADAGRYSVLVSNVVGNVTSMAVEVSVNSPVTILSQPAALTVSAGSPAVFTVNAEGTGPLTYQWRRNGSPVAGGTAASLAIGSAQSADAGSYDVLVANPVGSITSSAAALVVHATASLTSEPADVVANPGAPVTFSVTAAGTGPFTYQWRRNGVDIAGGTLTTLTLAAVQLSDVGTYDVQVTNSVGSVVSRGATLSLNTPLTIVTQPRGVTVNQGAAWSLSVAVAGTGPFTYQWRKGGSPVVGGTGATLAVAAAEVADAGSYDVVVGNVVGQVTSIAVAVGVNAAATIAQQPASVTLEMCAPLTLRVTAEGTGPFSYQWRKNGVPIPDAVGAVYTNPAAGPGDGGSYDVVITNMVGSLTSGLAQVVVTEVPGKVYPPTIAKHPMRALVQPGAPLTLRVSAVGTGPLAYQWFLNGVALQGATGETYSVAAMGASNMGLYCVRVTNGGGAVLSEKAQVIVAGAPGIVKDPTSFKELQDGATVRLSATARGTLPFNYTWKKDDGTSVASGALAANPAGVEIPLSIVAGGKTMGSYRLVVWNEFGREESAPATVELAMRSTRLLRHGWTVLLAPKDYPAGVNKVVGTFPSKAVTLDDTLIVSFGSVDTHTYEWGYSTNSTPQPRTIPGQTKPYLALMNVPGLSLTSAYILQVKITAKSSGAVWVLKFATSTWKPGAGNVLPPVAIALDLNDAYVPSGGTGNFGVALTANGAQYGATFNWYRQGLLGAPVLVGVNSTGFFSVPRVTSADDADYFVVVVDALGRSVESKRAHLWVFPDGE